MKAMTQYRIFPEKVEPYPYNTTVGKSARSTAWENAKDEEVHFEKVFFLGLLLFVLFDWFILRSLLDSSYFQHLDDHIGENGALLVGAIVFLGIVVVPFVSARYILVLLKFREYYRVELYLRSNKYKLKMVQEETQRREAEAEHVAHELTSRAVDILESSMALESSCWTSFQEASQALQQAQYEYDDRAFAPFWDAIEEAIYHLASFNDAVLQLPQKHQEYYLILQGRKHTFPPFPITPESLPNPSPIINELYNLVRQGQKDFQFALIWEQIKTREVLIAGFTTLADAIKGIGATVNDSMNNMMRGLFSS